MEGYYQEIVRRFRVLLDEVSPLQERFPRLFKMITGSCHGIDHWTRVGIYTLIISRGLREQERVSTPCLVAEGALENAGVYAAFFHDCARASDGFEFDHGRAGNQVWEYYAKERGLEKDFRQAVSQALLFHVDHPAVDPAANEVTMCLCNADRLDRVRLGEIVKPGLMYPDGVWKRLEPYTQGLLRQVTLARVKADLGL